MRRERQKRSRVMTGRGPCPTIEGRVRMVWIQKEKLP